MGIPEDARCILVSGGGGGDDGVERLLSGMRELVREEPNTWMVFAAGPLYRGRRSGDPRTVWWTTPDLYEFMPAFDAAVCAGGFNTVHELMQHGIPTVFVAQDKIADDQDGRIERLVDRGAALRARLDDGSLRVALGELADPAASARLSAAAKDVAATDGARRAAAEVLDVVLPVGVLARAREQVDDETLASLVTYDVALTDLVELAACFAANAGGHADRERLDLSLALDIVADAHALELPLSTAIRLARQFGRRFKRPVQPSEDELVDAFSTLIGSPHVRGQWSALSMLLGALVGERVLTPAALVEHLAGTLDRALDRGVDVLGAARMLLEQADDFDGRSNGPLLDAVEARLDPHPEAAG
jgi:hypothetical protein